MIGNSALVQLIECLTNFYTGANEKGIVEFKQRKEDTIEEISIDSILTNVKNILS